MKEKFPNGIEGNDPTEVFLAVHERLQRQNSSGSVAVIVRNIGRVWRTRCLLLGNLTGANR